MACISIRSRAWRWALLPSLICIATAQTASAPKLDNSGHITVDGKPMPYTIRHLPVSSFPALPQTVSAELEARGCLIPQTYEAHQPENVVHGSLESAGSTDWA